MVIGFWLLKFSITTIKPRLSKPILKKNRTKFQELTGLLWEECFNDELVCCRNSIISYLKGRKGRLENHVKDMIQEMNLVPQDPSTPYDDVVSREGEGLKILLDEILTSLSPREQRVLKMRFYEDKTLDQCVRETKIARGRIRQIEAKALRKMRHPTRIRQIYDSELYSE